MSEVRLRVKQTWEGWMKVANDDLTMQEAVERLEALGNRILEVDEVNRRIKVLHEEG